MSGNMLKSVCHSLKIMKLNFKMTNFEKSFVKLNLRRFEEKFKKMLLLEEIGGVLRRLFKIEEI